MLRPRVCACVCHAPPRLTITDNSLSVVFTPTSNWLGTDSFTYAVVIGAVESAPSTVVVHVRKCRLDCANEYFDDVSRYLNGL